MNGPASSFQIGGSISETTSIYIKREADEQLFQALRESELCYVLNSRQMGKSSLLLNVKSRLQQQGCTCSFIDLSRIGSVNVSSEQWYAGICSELWRGFSLGEMRDMLEWWRSLGDITPAQKLLNLFRDTLLQHYPGRELIIFFDEVDSVMSLPFPADDFFSIIRACYNQRADDPRLRDIGFAFFGVALPSDLVSDNRRSPFNIGRGIPLEGFTAEEAQPLAAGLIGTPYVAKELLSAVLSWTHGQPFLTQKICQLIIDHAATATVEVSASDWVDQLIQTQILDNWESNDNPEHLRTIRDRMLLDDQYSTVNLASYAQLLASPGETLQVNEMEGFSRLYLTGLIASNQGLITPRTGVYRQVFNEEWLQAQLDSKRPYAQNLKNWLCDQSEQWLLNNTELQDARQWSKGKHLPEEDHRFITASQTLLQRETQDWNERLQAEVEQRLLAETELQKALSQLREANQVAEQASQAKSDFLARISREVRTPINSVMGLSHLALQRDCDDLSRDYLQKIHRTTLFMLGMVSDMVDITKLERGEMALEQEAFLLDSVLDNLVDITAPRICEKGLSFHLQLPSQVLPPLSGDAMRLQQMLLNLITNAIEHTQKGRISLKLSVEELKQSAITLRFSLADTGSGISPNPVEGVIDKSKNSALKPGLGLSLCYELSALMGGELYVYSQPDQGTEFSFNATIDLSLQSMSPAPKKYRAALCAEPSHVDALRTTLALLGHHVTMHTPGEVSVGLPESKYDKLILSLASLPGRDAFQEAASNNSTLDIYPLITAGLAVPHWLSPLRLKPPVQHPTTPTRLQDTLDRQRNPVSINSVATRFTQKYQILVAEDNAINQQIVTELLEQQGLEVSVVNNGQAALQALQENQFDLVLMDIEMPVMDGVEAVTRLRILSRAPAFEYLENLPVIAMTAHALVSDRERFLAAGMSDYLAKPLKPNELNRLLRQWLPGAESSPEEQLKDANVNMETPWLDKASGLERCGGNTNLYMKLLRDFANNYGKVPDIANLPSKELTTYAHGLKGSAANLGLSDLSDYAASMEASGRQGGVRDSSLAADFQASLRQVCKQLLSLTATESRDVSPLATNPVQAGDAVASTQVSSKLRLMLVDTELQERKPLIDVLMKEYSVVVANSPGKAMALANSDQHLDAAVINTSLHQAEDGIALCEQLRNLPNKQALRVILLSHSGTEDEFERGLAAGASDFMLAPVSPTLLCARLAAHLS